MKSLLYYAAFLLLFFVGSINAQTALVPNAAAIPGSTTTSASDFGLCSTSYKDGALTVNYHTYVATADAPCASLTLNPDEHFTGVFIYEDALPTSSADVCHASAFTGVFGDTNPFTANFSMTAGKQYYFLVATWGEGDTTFEIDLDLPVIPTPFVVMSTPASPVEISDGTILNFYDSGGPTCDYEEDESYTLTICPDAAAVAADKIVQIEFTDFDINNTCETNTSLRIYKGASVVPANEIPIDGKYLNQDFITDVRIFTAITAGGCMTLTFDNPTIGGACEGNGWTGNFTLIDNPCTTTLMGDECASAATLLSGETLSSTSECFTGSLSACGVGFNNNGWFKFTASDPTVNILYAITGGNACYTGTGGDDDELPNMTTGIQMVLFEDCGAASQICTSTLTTGGIDVANGVYAAGTWEITDLTVGATYYAMFDGYGTDLCNFNVTGDFGIALPVELASFTAKEQGRSNLLEWSTASEENTAMHIVERSEDGRIFNEIGSLSAVGTSSELLRYSYSDDEPTSLDYYRIKSLDFDGTITFSSIVSIQRKSNDFDVSSIAPNPTKGIVNIRINSSESREVVFSLTNINGQTIMTKQMELSKGEQVRDLDMSALPKGLYFVNFVSEEGNVTYKIIKD